jgi:hypothetical protein
MTDVLFFFDVYAEFLSIDKNIINNSYVIVKN